MISLSFGLLNDGHFHSSEKTSLQSHARLRMRTMVTRDADDKFCKNNNNSESKEERKKIGGSLLRIISELNMLKTQCQQCQNAV